MELPTIAIIPARGGSKRIPRKNIKLFEGIPLVTRSVQTALQSKIFDLVYVSTDDEEIAKNSLLAGAQVPFLRSSNLSGDNVMTVPVIADFIEKLKISPESFVCCIYPTAPLLNSNSLVLGLNELKENKSIDYVLGITKYNYPIQRALIHIKNSEYTMLNPEYLETRSQDLEETWHDTGTFYWAHAKTWSANKSMLKNFSGIKIPSHLVQDIDDEEDWIRAEKLYRANKL